MNKKYGRQIKIQRHDTHIASVVPVVAKSISLYVLLNSIPMHDLSGLVRSENLGGDVQLELLR